MPQSEFNRFESPNRLSDKQPKTIQTCFRLTPSTHALLHARAHAAGLSTKVWLDQAIVENKTKIIVKQKSHPDLRPLLFHVHKAGNNINQLAHHFNTLKLENKLTKAEFFAAIAALERIQEALLVAVDYAR